MPIEPELSPPSEAIEELMPTSRPAAKGGLRQGDVVVAVGGTPVVSAESLVAHIREQAVGSTVELTIVRDGKEQQVDVTLGQRPQDG